MKAAAVPTVFIVDDDAGMRPAIEDLVESVGCVPSLQLVRSFSESNAPLTRVAWFWMSDCPR